MICITGAVHRSFNFPADLPTACAYFRDFSRLVRFLPHIELARTHGPHQFRVLYHTLELGVYRVRIYCDIETQFEARQRVLHVRSLTGPKPVRPRVTLTSLTAQGNYTSHSSFNAQGRHTRVEYQLALHAELPKPLGLQLIPDRVVEKIAEGITVRRIREIADGFITRAIWEFERGGRERRQRNTGSA
jgi:hypothetical protein